MLHDNVLVKRLPDAEQSKGGIYLAGREKCNLGYVISTGPGIRNKHGTYIGLWFSVGDLVLFEKFAGFDLIDAETREEYMLLKHREIMLTLGRVEI